MVGCEVMLCDSKWLCDLVDWKMMCCNYSTESQCHSTAIPYFKVLPSTTSIYCKVLEQSTTQYDSVLQSTTKCYPVLIRLIVATHETSSTLRGATYGMQNAMELRHSCLKLQHMQRHLHCADQQESPSNITKYCACHEK